MYAWVAQFLIAAAMTVVSAMLAPKPKDAEPSALGEFQMPTAEEGRPIPMVLGTCKVKAPNITWWGALRTAAIRRISNALTGSRTTIGFRYHLGMQHALALGPIDELVDIVVGDKSLKAEGAGVTIPYAAAGADVSINLYSLFGGDEKEGGLGGAIRFYFGSSTQSADPYLVGQFGGAAPAWRGICYAVLKDFYLGTSRYPSEWAWVLRCCPCAVGLDAAKRNINGDANPAYGLVHILTQPREQGGCGEALGTLDVPTFQAAANTLYSEGFGISLLMDRAQSADSWMGEILRHVDGVLYTDPATGLTSLKLIRADYDPGTLPEFAEADLQGAPEVTLAAPPDTINRVVIRYVDRSKGYTVRTAQDQDSGNYWARGEGADTTMDFMGLSNATMAQYVAAREIRGLASPLAKGTLTLNRKGWQLRPGSPFKLTFGPQGWDGLICRVTNIRYGTLGAGRIAVEFAQDVFSVGTQAYTPPPGGGWTDPVTAPQPCAAQAMLEAPHWLAGEARSVLALGARADQITLGAEVWTNEGAGYLLTKTLESMAPTGLLTSAYPAQTAALDATGFTVGGADLAQLVALATNADGRNRGVNLAWFPATGEIVSWTTCTDNGNSTYTMGGVLRGVMDTVPADQALNGRVWFWSAEATVASYPADLTLNAKLLPWTPWGILPIASATQMQLVTVSRAWAPLPPGNVQLNSQPYASWPANTTGDVTLSWSHRSRASQGPGTLLVPQDTTGSYAIEGTLTIEVLIAGVVKRTWTGLTGTSQIYTLAQRTADDAVLSKAVQFRLKPINGSYAGTIRTTPPFVMA